MRRRYEAKPKKNPRRSMHKNQKKKHTKPRVERLYTVGWPVVARQKSFGMPIKNKLKELFCKKNPTFLMLRNTELTGITLRVRIL